MQNKLFRLGIIGSVLSLPITIVFPVTFYVAGLGISFVEFHVAYLFILYLVFAVLQSKGGVIRPFYVNANILMVLAFAFSSLISLVLSGNISKEGILFVIRYFEGFIVVFVCVQFFSQLNISKDWLLKSILLAGTLGAIFTILQHFLGIGTVYEDAGSEVQRAGGLKHGAPFGAILSSAIILSFVHVTSIKDWIAKGIYGILLFICLLGLFFTYTRTWFISAFAAIALLFVLRGNIRQIIQYGLGIVLAAGAFIYLFADKLNVGGGVQRLMTMFDWETLTGNSRLFKWIAALMVFQESPIWGVGPENLELPLILWVKWIKDEAMLRSDSQYFDLLAVHGLVGFFLFIIINLTLLKDNLLAMRRAGKGDYIKEGIVILHIGWLIGGFFWAIIYYFVGTFYFYTLAVIIFFVKQNKLEKKQLRIASIS